MKIEASKNFESRQDIDRKEKEAFIKNLKPLAESEFKPESGKFRVITVIDSKYYQIGKDAVSLAEARNRCFANTKVSGQYFMIFDEKGNICPLVENNNY